jgi:hypothetical protein
MRRRRKLQAAPVACAVPPSTGSTRRGLVRRYFGALAQRRVVRALTTPAAVPLVLVGVSLVLLAVAVGAVLGAALVAGRQTDV